MQKTIQHIISYIYNILYKLHLYIINLKHIILFLFNLYIEALEHTKKGKQILRLNKIDLNLKYDL